MISRHKENEQLPAMVAWFRDSYSHLAPLLVYCPRVTRYNQSNKGVIGSAELILLHPAGGYSCLCIQVLSSTERNSDLHKSWRVLVENEGCKCVTVRDLSSFADAVEEYLENSRYE